MAQSQAYSTLSASTPLDLTSCGATQLAWEYASADYGGGTITIDVFVTDADSNSTNVQETWNSGSPIPSFPHESAYAMTAWSGVDWTRITNVQITGTLPNSTMTVAVNRIYLK